VIGDADQHAAVLDHGDDAGSGQGAEDASASPVEASSTDDDSGNNFQFQAQARDRIALSSEHGELVEAGDADEEAGECVDQDAGADDIDAAETSRGFIGPDREDVAAKDGVPECQRHDGCQDQHDPDTRRDQHPLGVGIGFLQRRNGVGHLAVGPDGGLAGNGAPDALESGRRKALIVDDDEELVELIRDVFDADGRFDVRVANNGFDAGMMVKEYKPDIIVLDVMLPDINGKEVCQRVRSDSTLDDVRIICISGMVEADKIDDLKEAGADDFMQKPFEVDSLFARVCELLDIEVPA